MHNNQRTPLSISIVAIVALSMLSTVPARIVRAEDQQGGEYSSSSTLLSGEHGNEVQSVDQEEEDIQNTEVDEHAIGQNVDYIKKGLSTEGLLEVDVEHLQTYGDAIALLEQYRTHLSDIKTALEANATSSLTTSEQVLFERIMVEHRDRFDSLDARIVDVDKQMSDLIDILTPIKDEPITEAYGLKGLLVAELKDFRDAVERIKDFGDVDLQIVEVETD